MSVRLLLYAFDKAFTIGCYPDESIYRGRIPDILGAESSRSEIFLLDPEGTPLPIEPVLVSYDEDDNHFTYSTIPTASGNI